MNLRPRVRRMKEADIDIVLDIEANVFVEQWSRESYLHEIQHNRFSIPLILELDGEIIGHAVAWAVLDEFHIASIAIAAAYQRQGWGQFLLRTILGMADLASYALLEVRETNVAAIRLYEKFGFEQYGRRRKYYRNGEDAIVMKLSFE